MSLARLRERGTLSTALSVLGAALVLAGGFALYAREELFDSDAFSQTAARSLQDDSVRNALSAPIVEQIVDLGPDELINVQPLLEGAVSGALETSAFRTLFREAVRKAHRAIFAKDRDELVLTIREADSVISGAVRAFSPDTAKQIPDDVGARLVRVTDSDAALTLARIAEDSRVLGLVLPPLGILVLVGAVFTAPDRRRGLVNSFVALAAGAAIAFVALLVARTLLLRGFDDDTVHDAVAALYDAYLSGLGEWLLLGGVVCVGLAAAAAATEPKPLERPRRLLRWIARTPETRGRRAGRGVAIGIASVIAFLEPVLALEIVAVFAGAVGIYYAVVEVIAAIAPGRAAAGSGGRGRAAAGPVSWRAPAAAAAFIVAAAVALAFVITDERKQAIARPAGPVKACNGYAKLCDRSLEDVVFPGSHNSMSAAELPGWFAPNQRRGIPRQLDEGVRAFLIDTHYGIERSSGPVLTDLEREGTSQVNEAVREQLGPEGERQFRDLSAKFAASGGGGTPGVYLCHVVCELGSVELTTALGWFKDFLDTHPDELVILFIEDKVSPEDTAEAFEESGILRYAYVHRAGRPFPTMRELISSDKRLFVMAEEDGGGDRYPWFHEGFDLTQETPFTFESPKELNGAGSCAPNRGSAGNPLFQINHWVEQIPRSPKTAAAVNAFKPLKQRARRCQRRRGLLPNILGLDYYDKGDLDEVSRVLNGLPRDAQPSYREAK